MRMSLSFSINALNLGTQQVELEDPVENIGAKLVRQAAAKTNDLAGDGTTTSVVLAQGLIAEGVKVGSLFSSSNSLYFIQETVIHYGSLVPVKLLRFLHTSVGCCSGSQSSTDHKRH